MIRWPSIADRAAWILIVVLAVCGVTTLAAQQPASTRSATPATSSLPGPRLQAEWPRFEPSVAESRVPVRPLLASNGNHTIAISTLALVLITVIVVLLVVK